ncbi:MAG: hypothetical protein ABIJ96_17480 [Elusimicrobiota bacterium]
MRCGLMIVLCGGLLAPAAAEKPAGLTDAQQARYVTAGEFLIADKFEAERFARILADLPALKKEDSALYRDIRSALKKRTGDKAKPLLDYFERYVDDPCIRDEVGRSHDDENFDYFYQRTVAGEIELKAVCKDIKKGRNEEAAKPLDAMIKRVPMNTVAYLHRAIVRLRSGDAAGAGGDYREALKTPVGKTEASASCLCCKSLAPDLAQLQERRALSEAAKKAGTSLFIDGNAAGALAKFDEALRHDPGDPEAFVSRAVARQKTGGEPALAVADYHAASKFAVAAGRWDLAADALLSSAQVSGVDEKAVLPVTVARIEEMIVMTTPEWQEKLAKELQTLRPRLQKILPPPAEKKPAPGIEPEGKKAP